jgi:hypothetical protein
VDRIAVPGIGAVLWRASRDGVLAIMGDVIVNMPPLEAVSISNTRLSNRAQRMRVGAEGGDASA